MLPSSTPRCSNSSGPPSPPDTAAAVCRYNSGAMAALNFGFAQRPHPPYPADLSGHGLELRPWSAGLVAQMAQWGERGFPYQSFDLGYLRDPARAASALEWTN